MRIRHLKRIFREVAQKGNIASAERVCKKKFLKVGAWQGDDLPAFTVKVGSDGLLMFAFPGC